MAEGKSCTARVIQYLTSAAGVMAYGDIPSSRPDTFLTVTRVGTDTSHVRSPGIDHPVIQVTSYAASRGAAQSLGAKVEQIMSELSSQAHFGDVYENSSSDGTDVNGKPLYVASYVVTFQE